MTKCCYFHKLSSDPEFVSGYEINTIFIYHLIEKKL